MASSNKIHKEEHLASSEFITDIVIGMSLFGYFKSKVTGQPLLKGALKVTLIGITAAAAAFIVAKSFSNLFS